MPDLPAPVIRLVDLAVFAPIGAAARACDALPQLVCERRGRVERHLQLARMIGKVAVKQGRRELERRLDEIAAEQQALGGTVVVPEQAPPAGEAVPEPVVELAGAAVAAPPVDSAAVPPPVEPAVIAPPATELAISDYDSLAASQVVARLAALTPDDLAAVGAYEAAHRARRTILGKVQQLQGS